MRKLSILGISVLLIIGAGLTVAASPSPSPAASPAASPSSGGATTTPATTPATGTAGSSSSWSAAVAPQVGLTGSIHVRELGDGTGRVDVRLVGLDRTAPWVIELTGGTPSNPNLGDMIAVRTGSSVARTGIDTIVLSLSKAEMTAFRNDRAKFGVVVSISDGTHESVASIPTA